MHELEPILTYQLNELEAKAYKVMLMWRDAIKKQAPDYITERMVKGDPRKSSLFKYAYKLVKETKDQIQDNQYKLYILAQIQMVKNYSDGNIHGLLVPAILVGEKAWIRWKIWKKAFETHVKRLTDKKVETANKLSIITSLKNTKKFLIENLGESYIEPLKEIVQTEKFKRWVNRSKLSPYYILLSPHISNIMPDVGFDLDVYRNSIDDEVKSEFKNIFGNEF